MTRGRETRRSLGRRFTSIAALVALALATLTVGIGYRTAYTAAEEDARQTLAGLVEAVRNTAAVGAYAGDQVLLGEVAQGLVSHPMVAAVRIELAQGAVVERRREDAGDTAGGAPAGAEVNVPLSSPFDRSERVGQIRVSVQAQALSQLARHQALMLTVPMLAQVLVLALVLGWVAARLLSRPMASLARDLAQLQPGSAELLPMPAAHQHDEIGLLVRHTNDLLLANATALGRERQLRAEVSAIEGQLRRLLDASSAAIFLLDGDGRLVQGNPTLLRLCTGRADGSLAAERFVDEQFAQPDALRALMARALAQQHSVSADLPLRHGGPPECWVHVLLSPLAGDDGQVLLEGVMYDVTQRRSEELRARHQAEHDPLTGLRNRAGLVAELDRHIDIAVAGGPPLSLLYLDLDGFKAVNDQRGHEAGDAVLREVAARLQGLLRRSGDTVARLGGDEFVILLPAMDPGRWLAQCAWRVVDELARPIALPGGGEPARIGASVGLASLPQDGTDRETLLRQADQAMYQVKRAGKQGVGTPEGPLLRPAD